MSPGNLASDGQPHGLALLDRQLYGKLDAVRAAGFRGDVLGVLGGREDLGQDGAELHLSQDAARLDVGERLLEVSHAGGERLHVAKAAIDGLEALVDLLERGGQAVVERLGEAVVHRGAHLVELAVRVLPDEAQLLGRGLREALEVLRGGLGARGKLRGDVAAHAVHAVSRLLDAAGRRVEGGPRGRGVGSLLRLERGDLGVRTLEVRREGLLVHSGGGAGAALPARMTATAATTTATAATTIETSSMGLMCISPQTS